MKQVLAQIDAFVPSAEVPLGLAIDGTSINLIASDQDALKIFFRICMKTSATIACRLAPKQKSFLVRLVKENMPQVITVAVGDGANDVTMILEAHVGVGIR